MYDDVVGCIIMSWGHAVGDFEHVVGNILNVPHDMLMSWGTGPCRVEHYHVVCTCSPRHGNMYHTTWSEHVVCVTHIVGDMTMS